jgi:hypothetical protein
MIRASRSMAAAADAKPGYQRPRKGRFDKGVLARRHPAEPSIPHPE